MTREDAIDFKDRLTLVLAGPADDDIDVANLLMEGCDDGGDDLISFGLCYSDYVVGAAGDDAVPEVELAGQVAKACLQGMSILLRNSQHLGAILMDVDGCASGGDASEKVLASSQQSESPPDDVIKLVVLEKTATVLLSFNTSSPDGLMSEVAAQAKFHHDVYFLGANGQTITEQVRDCAALYSTAAAKSKWESGPSTAVTPEENDLQIFCEKAASSSRLEKRFAAMMTKALISGDSSCDAAMRAAQRHSPNLPSSALLFVDASNTYKSVESMADSIGAGKVIQLFDLSRMLKEAHRCKAVSPGVVTERLPLMNALKTLTKGFLDGA